MRVYICGVRGSTPASGLEFCRYGGHTASIAIGDADGPPRLIIDAGTGIRQVTDLLRGQPFRGSILLRHLHWDHLQGLPFFSAGDRPDARVDVYVPQQPGAAADNLADMMAPPHFPITPVDLHGQWTFTHIAEGTREIDGFVVTAREIPHKGGRTFGYRVENGSGAAVYLSDHGPIELGAGPAGFGPYHEAALTLADRADLLIHDAQYVEEEWPHALAFRALHGQLRHRTRQGRACPALAHVPSRADPDRRHPRRHGGRMGQGGSRRGDAGPRRNDVRCPRRCLSTWLPTARGRCAPGAATFPGM